MKKFKFLKFSKTKKLRYSHKYSKEKIYLVFLHGFMSDLEGKKPQTFFKFARKFKEISTNSNIIPVLFFSNKSLSVGSL